VSVNALEGRPIELIAAPSSLGLRPGARGVEPGTWRAPAALLEAGMASALNAVGVVELPKPPYAIEPQPATRIRNGITLREHALVLGSAVEATLSASRFPVVLGGDCSVLLGSLLGARRGSRCGLLHVDGHTDFFHPGNYDSATRLGSAAGMDLALVTGRGELLLTHWPEVGSPLVADEDVIQIGDREAEADGHGQLPPSIARLTVQELLRVGIGQAVEQTAQGFRRRGLARSWLHVDLDVLDRQVMPAVDSPGSPGLDFDQLAELIAGLVRTAGVVGLDVTIYDPLRDRRAAYPAAIVACLAAGLAPPGGARSTPVAAGARA
jgi:arginase